MSWYELLLTIHIAAVGLWLGSGITIATLGSRALAVDPPSFGPLALQAGWWAGRAHPGAAVVILIAGILMVIDADLSFGDAWISIAIGGWIVLMALSGGVIGRASTQLMEGIQERGGYTADLRPVASRLLLSSRVESVLLVLVIADMVAKPG